MACGSLSLGNCCLNSLFSCFSSCATMRSPTRCSVAFAWSYGSSATSVAEATMFMSCWSRMEYFFSASSCCWCESGVGSRSVVFNFCFVLRLLFYRCCSLSVSGLIFTFIAVLDRRFLAKICKYWWEVERLAPFWPPVVIITNEEHPRHQPLHSSVPSNSFKHIIVDSPLSESSSKTPKSPP